MKTSVKHNISYIFLALLVFAIMFLLLPAKQYKPTGVFLPTTKQQYHPSNEAQVFPAIPLGYKKIGIVKMTLHSDANQKNQQDEKAIVYAALKNAAQHGGEGLIIKQLYFLASTKYGKIAAGYHFKGEVIKQGNSNGI